MEEGEREGEKEGGREDSVSTRHLDVENSNKQFKCNKEYTKETMICNKTMI